MLNFCSTILRDRSEAEDKVQETFLKAFESLDRFDPSRGLFSSWLLKIAQNKCIDVLRARRGWDSLGELAAQMEPAPIDESQSDRLAEAIESLSGKQRTLLFLKYDLGLGTTEIAEHLDMSPGNVRVALHRTIRTLRGKVEP